MGDELSSQTHPNPKLRMQPYDEEGKTEVLAALAQASPWTRHEMKTPTGEIERRLLPIHLTASNANWGVVVDVPEATVTATS